MKSVLTGILALALLAIGAAFGRQVTTPPQQTPNSLQAVLADPNLATTVVRSCPPPPDAALRLF
jgi:hypothetical protein